MNAEQQLKRLNSNLEAFTNAYNNFKAVGIDEDILEGYIIYKTKLSKKQVRAILASQKDFYDRLSKKLVLDALEATE